MITFHKDGQRGSVNEIFVFGSNLAGIHGAGAAEVARVYYQAEMGVGVGRTGYAYAIPTKDRQISNTLDLIVIKQFVDDFIEYTKANPQLKFFVTRVGCGLAGLRDDQIAPMFKGAINCSFAEQWKPWLNETSNEV